MTNKCKTKKYITFMQKTLKKLNKIILQNNYNANLDKSSLIDNELEIAINQITKKYGNLEQWFEL